VKKEIIAMAWAEIAIKVEKVPLDNLILQTKIWAKVLEI
jgi:hypothetical protein